MNRLFLVVTLLVPQSSARGNDYPLSTESKQFVAGWAVAGAVVAGGIGLVAALDKQSTQKQTKHKSTWEKITSFPWHYVILPALVGAAGAGYVASCFTTEAYLKSAEQELALIENDRMVKAALETDNPAELTKVTYLKTFPSLSAVERLEALLKKIEQARDYLMSVIKSGSAALKSIAEAALTRLNAIEQRIINAIVKLKNASYFKELAIRTEIDYKNQVIQSAQRTAAAAEAQARAAQSAAHAAWHTAHHHSHPVYVAPPPVHVYVKK